MNLNIATDIVTDVLIVGGGAAGCRAALAAVEMGARVTLLDKGAVSRSGITITAGGGIQAPFHPDDSEELFFQDVWRYGYLLGDQNLIYVLVQDARARVEDLERYGVAFRKQADGSWLQFQMPGQSLPRNVRLAHEGFGLMAALRRAVLRTEIGLVEDCAIIELLQTDEQAVVGAVALDLKSNQLVRIRAGAVVIATGGYETLWKVTDCPADATGEGLMLAYRAGAKLVDLEMVLFYPSVVIWPPAAQGSFVHYEWLGEWACNGEIRGADGASILPKPLPVRDVAMRTMWEAIEAGCGTPHGGLWWDVSRSPKGRQAVDAFLQGQQYRYMRDKLGFDPSTEMIEVAPGAHYQLGGIHIDERCATGVTGLYAVPEAAGNFEGANRLSGSALAGTQVFGTIAGREAARWSASVSGAPADRQTLQRVQRCIARFLEPKPRPASLAGIRRQLTEAVWQHLGLRRSAQGLEVLEAKIEALRHALDSVVVHPVGTFNQALLEAIELDGMLDLAALTARAALMRTESRGHHFRTDFPERDDHHWLCHTALQLADGVARSYTVPVDESVNPRPAEIGR
jgi:succinate dehydrogenase/fumarate reductase flavoprotein subunit